MPLRPAAAVLAAVVLLALVALASHAGERSLGSVTIAKPAYADTVVSTLAVLFMVAGIGAIVIYAVSARSRRAGRRRPLDTMLALLLLAALGGIVAVLVAVIPPLGGDETVPPSGGDGPPQVSTSRQPAEAAGIDWLVAGVTAGVLLAGLLLLALAIRRENLRRPRLPGPPGAVLASLDESLDDLRAEPDPRRAVIAAYARMERALAVEGLERRASEAPLEYLARVLAELRASAGSSRRLTQLFERAKFSPHEVDSRMRDEAIAALEAVRSEVRDAGDTRPAGATA